MKWFKELNTLSKVYIITVVLVVIVIECFLFKVIIHR